MPHVENSIRTFEAGGTISQYARVKLSSGEVIAAGADDIDIGTCEVLAADGDLVDVRMSNAAGTRFMIASEAIAVGAKVYGAADGKVSDTASGRLIGIALEEATADGDIIEVLYDPSLVGSVQYLEETFSFDDMTDGGSTAGSYAFTGGTIPAGAQVLGWEANATAGFAGDTSAVIQVGISGNVNLYSAFTTGSVFAAGKVGSPCQVSTDNPYQASAQTPLVTITSGADFTSVSAGTVTVRIAFITF